MDSSSASHIKTFYWAGGLLVLAALALPWWGFDITAGPITVHLHSLKNPAGALFLALGLSPLIPTCRSWFGRAGLFLEDWGTEAPEQFLWLASGLAGLILSNIKLYQHFSLQTHAFDLGILANVCWNTVRGRFFYDSVKGASYFADHFQPALGFLAPALWVWNNAGIYMITQALGFAIGLPPLFKLTEKATGSRLLAIGLCLVYLTRPSVNAVNGFDLHPESLDVPIFLWALWFLEERRPAAFWTCCLLALTLKEDVPIATAALGLALFIGKPGWKTTGKILMLISAILFPWETTVVIPYFLHGMPSIHMMRYAYLGNSFGEILTHLVTHPIHFFLAVSRPPAKWSALLRFLGSFGFLPLLSPTEFFCGFLSLLPHLASGYVGQYTLSGQYTALSLPFMLAASSKGLAWARKALETRGLNGPSCLFAACLVFSGGALLTNSRYAKPVDWNRVNEFYRLIKTIPPDASVRAQSDLLPHVCLREKIFLFAPYEGYRYLPLFKATRADTDYILLDLTGNCWPMDLPRYEKEVLKLSQEGRYTLMTNEAGYQLWKRKTA